MKSYAALTYIPFSDLSFLDPISIHYSKVLWVDRRKYRFITRRYWSPILPLPQSIVRI